MASSSSSRPPAPLPSEAYSAATGAVASGGQDGRAKKALGSGGSSSLRPKACRFCGQPHSHAEPHLYNYKEEVDEDLTCQICLQPFVEPIDTPCGHTFCKACLLSYLKVNPMCPLDRKPLNEMVLQPSNLVLRRLLDKQMVSCPNSDSCSDELQRGSLDDHLKYRCSGTLVACQYAGAGCDYRGPKKAMPKHQTDCKFQKEGITRLPVLEGEVSHVEIPRTSSSLGMTIVGGADTPLRCVVVQEVYPDGLIASDGRLQPGDQVIEINGVDMTCAPHAQVCAALRKMTSVLRLGIYRERIEKYRSANNNNNNGKAAAASARQSHSESRQRHQQASSPPAGDGSKAMSPCSPPSNVSPSNGVMSATPDPSSSCSPHSSGCSPTARQQQQQQPAPQQQQLQSQRNRHPPPVPQPQSHLNGGGGSGGEELLTVTMERQTGKPLGIRLSGGDTEPTAGIFVADIQEGSTTQVDGRLEKLDRILFINGRDVRNAKLTQASALIQNNDRISLVVARKKQPSSSSTRPVSNSAAHDEVDGRQKGPLPSAHIRPPLPLPVEDEDEEIAAVAAAASSAHAAAATAVARDNDGLTISHARSKSAPAIHNKNNNLRAVAAGAGAIGGGAGGSNLDSCANGNYEEEEEEESDAEESKNSAAAQEATNFARPQFVKNRQQTVQNNRLNGVNGSCKLAAAGGQSRGGPSASQVDSAAVPYRPTAPSSAAAAAVYDIPEGDDYMAIYETIDRKSDASLRRNEQQQLLKSHSMEALETPTHSIKGDTEDLDDLESVNDAAAADQMATSAANSVHNQHHRMYNQSKQQSKRRHKSAAAASASAAAKSRCAKHDLACNCSHHHPQQQQQQQQHHKRRSFHENNSITHSQTAQPQQASSNHIHPNKHKNGHSKSSAAAAANVVDSSAAAAATTNNGYDVTDGGGGGGSMAAFLRKALRMEGPSLQERTVTIKKTVRESLGMRIGGGIGSNEGDTPIYVANIHPHGCIGKSKQLKKGDILLSVDETSLCRLTHSQAVSTLKATINNDQVVLGIMDGPETSYGASNFIPSWMYWQRLPRSLQYPKTVILHRRERASWGFSIVGGAPDECSSSSNHAHPMPVTSSTSSSRPPTEPIHVLFVVPESPAAKDARLKCGDRLLAVDGHSLENIPHHLAVKMLKQTSTRVVLEVVSWMGTEL